jgi:hypothetical protein
MINSAIRIPKGRQWHFAALFWVIASSYFTEIAWSHPADQSDMRVQIMPNQLVIRFTFNLLTITRFLRVDANGDGNLDFTELKSAEQRLVAYLNSHVRLEVNQKPSRWGDQVRFDYLWPDPQSTSPMPPAQYEGRNMDITLDLAVEPLLEDFWIGFEIFEQTGTLQTIRGTYVQDGQTLDVPFSFEEPEYTYDTGYLKAPASPPNRTSYLQDSGHWIVAGGFTLTTMILVIWLRRKRELQHTNELVKPTES